jgi:cyclohexanone monooxygenase
MNGTTKPIHPLKAAELDTAAIAARYDAERAKRIREDGVAQLKTAQRLLPTYQDDAWAASLPGARDPVVRDTKVLIVGTGLSGVVAAVKLIGQRVEDLLMVDKAAGFGGTWYYNRYPGELLPNVLVFLLGFDRG